MKFLFSIHITLRRGKTKRETEPNLLCVSLGHIHCQMVQLETATCLWAFLCDLPKDDPARKKVRLNEQSHNQDTTEWMQLILTTWSQAWDHHISALTAVPPVLAGKSRHNSPLSLYSPKWNRSLCRWWGTGTGCPEKLCVPHPWKCWRPS